MGGSVACVHRPHNILASSDIDQRRCLAVGKSAGKGCCEFLTYRCYFDSDRQIECLDTISNSRA